MAILKIAQIGHPALRTPARALTREELALPETQRFIDNLIDTMRDAEGAGIAANQVHAPLAICTIEVANNRRYPYKPPIPLTVLVNPTIEYVGDATFPTNEGCLSVPLRGDLHRWLRVRVTAWDRNGVAVVHEPIGLTAGTFQHEIDHLNGTLVIDHVRDTRTLATWPMFERHRSEDFTRMITEFVETTGG